MHCCRRYLDKDKSENGEAFAHRPFHGEIGSRLLACEAGRTARSLSTDREKKEVPGKNDFFAVLFLDRLGVYEHA